MTSELGFVFCTRMEICTCLHIHWQPHFHLCLHTWIHLCIKKVICKWPHVQMHMNMQMHMQMCIMHRTGNMLHIKQVTICKGHMQIHKQCVHNAMNRQYAISNYILVTSSSPFWQSASSSKTSLPRRSPGKEKLIFAATLKPFVSTSIVPVLFQIFRYLFHPPAHFRSKPPSLEALFSLN